MSINFLIYCSTFKQKIIKAPIRVMGAIEHDVFIQENSSVTSIAIKVIANNYSRILPHCNAFKFIDIPFLSRYGLG